MKQNQSKKMDDQELEALRNQKIAELQNSAAEVSQEEAQLQQQIEQLEAMVKHKMTKEALQRYGNLKTAHPEKAIQVLVVLGQLVQQGKLEQINDESLKEILLKLTPEKKDFKIKKV